MNTALLICKTATGERCHTGEYPTVVAARRAGRRLVAKGAAASFRVYRRTFDEGGELCLVRQAPDTAQGMAMPRAFRASIRAGLVNLRIPGRVGKWRCVRRLDATFRGADAPLFVVESESFAQKPLMLVDDRRRVVCGIIRGYTEVEISEALERTEGWKLK